MRILVDLDGTLTDPFTGITGCIQYALSELGKPVPAAEELSWCIGPSLVESFRTLLGDDPHLAEDALAKYRERFGTVGLFENKVYPGIKKALTDLRAAGFELSVATAKPGVFARRIIDHFGLANFFCSVDGSELDGTRVDKAELIRFILERDGLAPEEVVMIGDREHDMIGARKNGVVGVGVLWGYGSREELESAGARQCLDAPRDLVSALSGIQKG